MKSTEFLKHTKYASETLSEETQADQYDLEGVGIYIPPLQQKIELLKKAVGVSNVYNEQETEESEEESAEEKSEDDDAELAAIKKMAGVNPAVIDSLVDDEPVEG